MLEPRIPLDEKERLQDLCNLLVLNTVPEERFDRVTRCAQRLFGVATTLISLVDSDRQWFKSRQGLDVTETPRNISFCGHAILSDLPFIVEDASIDSRFTDNPLVAGPLHLRFYAGMPLHGPLGYKIGTLCLIDYAPRTFNDADAKSLRDLAAWAELELNSQTLSNAIFTSRENELRLSTVLDNVIDGIVTTDANGMIDTINLAARRIFGFGQETLTSNNVRILIPEFFDEIQRISLEDRKRLSDGETLRINDKAFGQRSNGAIFPIELAIAEMVVNGRPGFIGIVRDITDTHRTQAQLQTAQERLSLALEGSELALWDWNIATGQVYLSARWLEMCGGPAQQHVSGFTELRNQVHPDDMKRREKETIAVLKGEKEVYHIEHRVRMLNGEWKWIESHGKVVERNAHGMALRMAGTNADISMRKFAENSLRESQEKTELASRAKSEFLANMSHEIRTPMNAVLGITHLLKETELSPEQRKYLEMIHVSGKLLLGILNDILDFSKIEAGQMQLEPVQFDLGTVLDVLAPIMSVNAKDKPIELAIGVDADVPLNVIGDSLRLQQVLVNLVGNAIKFTEQGAVTIHISLIDKLQDKAMLRFTIRDTGIGMSQEQQERLFSAFAQADSSMTRRFGGTGLGLVISRKLIEMMGGRLNVGSELGVGSEFVITVPLQMANAQQNAKETDKKMEGLHILVLDDNDTCMAFLRKNTEKWNWRLEWAKSEGDAIKQIRNANDTGNVYDALLIDSRIFSVDGLSAIRTAEAIFPHSSLPVVVMCNAFECGKLSIVENKGGISATLMKPVTGSTLFNALNNVLMRRTDSASVACASSARKPDKYSIHGIRILAVEDNFVNQVVINGLLQKKCAILDIVNNGLEAVERLRSNGNSYDLILMDVQMPVMDGYSATRLIRSELKLTIPVLAMTAGVTELEREQCIACGMDDFVGKPIESSLLFDAILRNLPAESQSVGRHDIVKTADQETQRLAIERASAVAAPIEPPIIDFCLMLSAMGNNSELVRMYTESFLATIDETLASIKSAVDSGNMKELRLHAHTVKGTVGFFHAKFSVDSAARLEEMGRTEDHANFRQGFADLKFEIERLRPLLQSFLNGDGA
jgi:two-component system sensor histidine kinase/response regulator